MRLRILGLTCLVTVLMGCGGVSSKKTEGEAKKTASLLNVDLPMAEGFVLDSIDFGVLNSGEIVRGNFTLNNKSEKALVILTVDKACGCTEVEWDKKPIAVGQSSDIQFEFNTAGLYGAQIKYFTVMLSDDSKVRVYFTADVN